MMTKVLTLRFNPLAGAFDDQPLVDFTRDKNLIAVENHFFIHDGLPFLVMVIDYRPGELLELEERRDSRRQREDHWRETLSDQALPLFNTLRQWRSARSKADGLPPYLIATNRQLAEIATARPQSITALEKIEGLGPARSAKYGPDILELVSTETEITPDSSTGTSVRPKEKTDGANNAEQE